jgi:hypothetical protein
MLLTPLQSAKGLDPEQLLGTALPPCVRAFVFLANSLFFRDGTKEIELSPKLVHGCAACDDGVSTSSTGLLTLLRAMCASARFSVPLCREEWWIK